MASNPPSGRSTPGSSTPNPRFTSQSKTAEDLLSTQTVGLVALSDFRKRRAEALEQKEKERDGTASATPRSASVATDG
jgi:protein FAM50